MDPSNRLFNDVVRALSMVLDFDEGEKLFHAWRTAVLAHGIAVELKLPEPGLLYHAGLLHDIGAIGLPDHIIHVVHRGDARKQVQQHAELGARIVQPFGVLKRIAPIIQDHHERFDGLGFPSGKTGAEISLQTQVLAAADTLELALRNVGRERRYAVACSTTSHESGRAWAPEVAEAALASIERDPAVLVRLFDDQQLERMVRSLAYTPPELEKLDRLNLLGQLLWVFGHIIDAKHPSMLGHSLRVTYFGYEVARAIGGEETNVWDVLCAGLLHDVGKVGVPRRLLCKAHLDEDDARVIRKHAEDTMKVISTIEDLAHLAYPAAAHHEWYDGTGYPEGKSGEDIPLLGRVLAFADTYEGLTNPNRTSLSHEAALDVIRARVGTQFDPHIADAAIAGLDVAGKAALGDQTLISRFSRSLEDDNLDVRTLLTDSTERLSLTHLGENGGMLVEVPQCHLLRVDARLRIASGGGGLAKLLSVEESSDLGDYLEDASRGELLVRMGGLEPDRPLTQYLFARGGTPLEVLVVKRGDGFEMFLRTAEDRFRTMKRVAQYDRNFMSSAEATFFTDTTGRIVDVNQAFLSLYGYRMDEVVGQTPGILEAEGDVDRLGQLLARTWAGGSWAGDLVTRKRSGELVTVQFTITSVRDATGNHVGHIGRAVDISERHRLELELEEKNAQLEHLSKLKSDLLATTSHDLKSPIAALISYADLLKDRIGETTREDAERFLAQMIASGHRALNLIDDLLDLERIDSGTFGVHKQPARLDDALRRALTLHEPAARAKNMEVDVRIQGANRRYVADESRMEQLFSNLISNAIKFSPRDSRVTVSYTDSAQGLCVEVIDEGPGIPPEARDSIFDRYFQLEENRKQGRRAGLGLGLAIAKGIVNEHSGSIRVSGGLEGGSRFVVELPPCAVVDELRAVIVAANGEVDALTPGLERVGVASFVARTHGDVSNLLATDHEPNLLFVSEEADPSVRDAALSGVAGKANAPLVVLFAEDDDDVDHGGRHVLSPPVLDVELAQLARQARGSRSPQGVTG